MDAFLERFRVWLPRLTSENCRVSGAASPYAVATTPTHAARQQANGWWTSKLGPSVVIEHRQPEDVGGGVYGEVIAVLSRKTDK
jgi:hypothetical protein